MNGLAIDIGGTHVKLLVSGQKEHSEFDSSPELTPAMLLAGALTALVGVVEPLDSQSARTFEYLQAVARKGQLDFIPQERKRPVASPVASIGLITEPANATAQALQEHYGPRYDAYIHWGSNE